MDSRRALDINTVQLDGKFVERKKKTLDNLCFDVKAELDHDKSPKGYVDEPLIPLIDCINKTEDFYTTSSCSGRITILKQELRKSKGGNWLLVSHQCITSKQVEDALSSVNQQQETNPLSRPSDASFQLTFRFEPLILHIECANLMSASQLLTLARGQGFRESGINGLSSRRIMLRISYNLRLEIPLFVGSASQWDERTQSTIGGNVSYLRMIVDIANDKMKENIRKIDSLYNAFRGMFRPSHRWYHGYDNNNVPLQIWIEKLDLKQRVLSHRLQSVRHQIQDLYAKEQIRNSVEPTGNSRTHFSWHLVVPTVLLDSSKVSSYLQDSNSNSNQNSEEQCVELYLHPCYPNDLTLVFIKDNNNNNNKISSIQQLIFENDKVFDYGKAMMTYPEVMSKVIEMSDCVKVILFQSVWKQIVGQYCVHTPKWKDQLLSLIRTDCESTSLCHIFVIGLAFRDKSKLQKRVKSADGQVSSTSQQAQMQERETTEQKDQIPSWEQVIYSRHLGQSWNEMMCDLVATLQQSICKKHSDNDDGNDHDHDDNNDNNDNNDNDDGESQRQQMLTSICKSFPHKFEKLGDCVLFPPSFACVVDLFQTWFCSDKACHDGTQHYTNVYQVIQKHLRCNQIGIQQRIRYL
ncbi:Met-10+ like family protein / kelch repeat-containing protein [Reticulomyxa filosa]|uniref:tRNA(Phe) 7-[(3-amino-3-carboxypropyl)-4-demethylwyosine(37)-N(4)]-methyltransferase n=1 Tax=Reticulomyxa filosa TaxID=46433 RepID=X6ML02_RETFI|nr:Met-10+ like family protein / kelch repeat-containing protein [Reticulomyxa filosa]|eukprot:ETO13750.1 Met-10+ like family protein / kelch repeat-containing protein [Reticulomyxa filosa]